MEQTKKGASIKATSDKELSVSVQHFDEVEIPVAQEKSYDDFVTYGLNNDFPQDLIDAWLLSGVHNAIATGIIQMIAGDGVTLEPKVGEVEVFAKRINRNGDTLQDLINKTAFDLYLHGYFGWQLVWNQARTKIVGIYHTPAEQIRSGKADDEGVINDYYTSWDWDQYRKEKFKPQKIKAFDPADRSEPKQMLFVKQYRPNQYYYSTPSYFGGMNWILIDNRASEFHLNNIENGFFPSSIVQFFNGEPPAEKKRALERKFMQKFTGKRQAKIVFVYNDNRDEEVTFSTHEPANIDKRFRDLMPEVYKNIMVAHRVTSPLLFGIRDSTGLGNNAEELESSSILMNKMVIIPFQNMILEALKEVFKINKWDVDITIETLQPLQFLDGESDDADASTDEEEIKPEKKTFSVDRERIVINDGIVPFVLMHLESKGVTIEEMEKEGFIMVSEGDRVTDEGAKHGYHFSTSANPTEDTEQQVGYFRVLYRYGVGSGQGAMIQDNTRDFCRKLVDLKQLYRYEDIDNMEVTGENAQFAKKGESSYSIFDWKGGKHCRHVWKRVVFMRTAAPTRIIPGYKVLPGQDVGLTLPVNDDNATSVNDD